MDNNLQQEFWSWSLRRYEDESLRNCLLSLQESCGLVAVEALFFAWLAERGRELSRGEVLHMEAKIEPWLENVLLPLRRRRVDWSDNPEHAQLRREALRIEIEAERSLAVLLCGSLEPPLIDAARVSYERNLSLITSLSSSEDLDRLIAAFGQ